MTAIEPNINATGRYSIGEASALLGMHRNTLRKYTEQGLIKCGYRKATARKFYMGSELLRLWKAQL